MLEQINLWHLIALSLGVCALIPYWVVATLAGRKQLKELQLLRQKLLHDLVYDGVAIAEETAYRAKKTSTTVCAEEKENIAVDFVQKNSKEFSEEEIKTMIPAILAKICGAGATNKVKL